MAWTATLDSVDYSHESITIGVIFRSTIGDGRDTYKESLIFDSNVKLSDIKTAVVQKLVLLEQVEGKANQLKGNIGITYDSSGNTIP